MGLTSPCRSHTTRTATRTAMGTITIFRVAMQKKHTNWFSNDSETCFWLQGVFLAQHSREWSWVNCLGTQAEQRPGHRMHSPGLQLRCDFQQWMWAMYRRWFHSKWCCYVNGFKLKTETHRKPNLLMPTNAITWREAHRDSLFRITVTTPGVNSSNKKMERDSLWMNLKAGPAPF